MRPDRWDHSGDRPNSFASVLVLGNSPIAASATLWPLRVASPDTISGMFHVKHGGAVQPPQHGGHGCCVPDIDVVSCRSVGMHPGARQAAHNAGSLRIQLRKQASRAGRKEREPTLVITRPGPRPLQARSVASRSSCPQRRGKHRASPRWRARRGWLSAPLFPEPHEPNLARTSRSARRDRQTRTPPTQVELRTLATSGPPKRWRKPETRCSRCPQLATRGPRRVSHVFPDERKGARPSPVLRALYAPPNQSFSRTGTGEGSVVLAVAEYADQCNRVSPISSQGGSKGC